MTCFISTKAQIIAILLTKGKALCASMGISNDKLISLPIVNDKVFIKVYTEVLILAYN